MLRLWQKPIKTLSTHLLELNSVLCREKLNIYTDITKTNVPFDSLLRENTTKYVENFYANICILFDDKFIFYYKSKTTYKATFC